jgi:hypothetical protein
MTMEPNMCQIKINRPYEHLPIYDQRLTNRYIRRKRFNTKLCISIQHNFVCVHKHCRYAHSLNELSPILCEKDNCTNPECKYIHNYETRDEYINRVYLQKDVI